MVNNNNKIQNMKIKQHLNWKNYGVYEATCNICWDLYIGQTINSFCKRSNAHINTWKNSKTRLIMK